MKKRYIVTVEGRRAVIVLANNSDEAEKIAVEKIKEEESYAGDYEVKDIILEKNSFSKKRIKM